jgi:3'-phosphoadenosine 5'-phosphosulfate sulfotransferase (PAPS reductase)/FAD synthetase
MRTLIWFSAGAASAVAAKLVLAENPEDVVIAYTDTGAEHQDNQRFLSDCEKWFNHPIIKLKSEKYLDTWDVWEKTRFLVSPQGARCTTELKKKLRQDFQQLDDIQVFGYTAEEKHRAERFREQNPEVNLRSPLIEHGLSKEDCLAMIDRANIKLPAMYLLGYKNNNCIGCPKGGMGYWNKIRVDFPEVFKKMSELEEKLGVTVLRANNEPLPLKDLHPGRGSLLDEANFECSLLCSVAEDLITDRP